MRSPYKTLSIPVWDKKFCCSNRVKNVITNTGEKEIYNPAMMNSVLEEADNRIVCHIFDMVQNHNVSHISIRTADSDVIVIILGFMQQLIEIKHDITVLVDFKSSTSTKIISLNTIFAQLGSQICSTLPFFHAFTGADATCSFFKVSKKEWFKCLMDFPLKDHLTTIFQQLTKCPNYEDVTNAQPLLQQFVVFVYLKKFETIDIDELRCNMFQNSSSTELRVTPFQGRIATSCVSICISGRLDLG